MNNEITIKIDGKAIKTRPGLNLVDVAAEHEIFIPSLCYYKHIDPPLGTCRVCVCKINGNAMPACTRKTYDGMEVELNTEELLDTRKAIVEMMFAREPTETSTKC